MILSAKNLKVAVKDCGNSKSIIRDISFDVEDDSCLGILGESGSGKSVTWKSIMGLLDSSFDVQGQVLFRGQSLLDMKKGQRRRIRGKEVGIVVQNPMTAFDPLFTIKKQMVETFRSHRRMSGKEAYNMSVEILEKLKIKDVPQVLDKYPHELSGGMLQRIMIGIAVAQKPALIIADEPTTAIDAINQTELLKVLREIREAYKISMIFISHDLGAVSRIADHIMVMAHGKIVEKGTVHEIMNNPQDQHTRYLVNTRKALLDTYLGHAEGGSDAAAG